MPDDRIPDFLSAHRAVAEDGENWHGVPGNPSEHRTVGAHRAWCFLDVEWCYPDTDGYCRCCDQITLPSRWIGMNTSTVLKELRTAVLELPTDGENGLWVVQDRVIALLDGEQ
jgi:hypothetical protein